MRWATVLGLLLVVGCGGGSSAPSSASQPGLARACTGALPPRGYAHVLLVVLENHSYADIAGHSPYLNALARRCGLSADYRAVAHPSLPNYLALTSGGTHGIGSDCTDCPVQAASIFGQLRGDWRSYLQSLPATGFAGAFSGMYAKKHNPAAYYTPIARAYARRAVPLAALRRDLADGTLPRFGLVVPNLCSDEHDCSVTTGDDWLRRWVPEVLASNAYRSGKTALFVTYDEGTDAGNHVYTVVAARSVPPHTVVRAPLDHYSLLRTVERLLGLPCLADACRARPMTAAFRLL